MANAEYLHTYSPSPQAPAMTRTDVFALKEQRRAALALMHSNMRIADEWLHADEDPSPIKQYINQGFDADWKFDTYPYAWTVLNRGVNQIQTAEVPEISYELPAADKKKHPAWSDDEKAVQQWAQGVVYKIVTQSTENPFLDLLQQQLGPGLGALHYPLDYDALGEAPDHGRGTPDEEDAWDAYDRQAADALPWRVTSLHPTWIFFDLAHDPPQDYIIERPVSLKDAERLFPGLRMGIADVPAGDDSTASILYTEYCDRDRCGAWIGTQAILEGADDEGFVPNALGHTWVQLAWSGLGKKDYRGAWHRRGVGMIQRGISTFRAMTRDDNILSLIKSVMIPKYIGRGLDKELTQQELADFDPTSPATGVLSSGTTLEPLAVPQIPPALIEDARQHQGRLEQLYGPGILSGQDAGAGEPASKWAARTEAARGPYRTPKKNAEQAGASMLADMLYDVAHDPALSGGMAVTYQQGKGKDAQRITAELKPSQIHPGGKFTFDFSPMSKDEKQARTEDTKARQDAGWISVETAMKAGGEVDDAEQELAEIQADRVMASPEFVAYQTQLAISFIQQALNPQPQQPPADQGAGAMPPDMGAGMGAPVGVPVPVPGQPVLTGPGGPPPPPMPPPAGPAAPPPLPTSGFRPPPQRNGAGGY